MIAAADIEGAAPSPEQDERALLAAIVDSSEDAIVSKDLDGIIVSWNRAAEAIFGYQAAEAVGRHISLIIPDDRLDEEADIIARIRAGERVQHFDTLRRRKDGSLVALSLTISPVRAADGRIVGASKIARDISERLRLEAAQRELSRELNHRSKNLLAIVQSIIRHTATRSTPETFLERIGERLQGLSANQDLLVENNWRGADVAALIAIQLGHVTDLPLGQVRLSGGPLLLAPHAAQTLAIAIHELASNAVRHGALSSPAGEVAIRWGIETTAGGDELMVSWRESHGPAVATPAEPGFGTAIIRRITGQSMGGRVLTAFEPTGFVWELRAPAAGLRAAPTPAPGAP
jgi:PAS domain S-box-containing protein